MDEWQLKELVESRDMIRQQHEEIQRLKHTCERVYLWSEMREESNKTGLPMSLIWEIMAITGRSAPAILR